MPVATDPGGLRVTWEQMSLVEDLEAWTVSDPGNQAFTPPGAARRTAAQLMRSAFGTAVAQLSARLGGSGLAVPRPHKAPILGRGRQQTL